MFIFTSTWSILTCAYSSSGWLNQRLPSPRHLVINPSTPSCTFRQWELPGLIAIGDVRICIVSSERALCLVSWQPEIWCSFRVVIFFTQKTWGRFLCRCCWLILLQWVEISTYSYCLRLRVCLVLLMDKMLHQLVTTAFRRSTASIKDPRPPSRIWKPCKLHQITWDIDAIYTLDDGAPGARCQSLGFPTPTWWGLDKISLKSMWTQWVYYFRKVASVVPSQQNMLCRDMMATTWTRVRLVLTWHSWDTEMLKKKRVRPHGWRMVKVDVASSLGV